MRRFCHLEFGDETLKLAVPATADLLSLPEDPALPDPRTAIRAALSAPRGAPPLADLVRARVRANPRARACVVVSDNTRPVPYKGEQGILEPILQILREERVADIEVLVGTGTHRPLADAELRRLLPEAAFGAGVRVTNHVCTDRASLRLLGRARGTEAWVNRRYLEADLRILTGFVEPHFMAGASGGPKAICPGLVGQAVTQVFHGPDLMSHPRCTTLVLDGNPCHEESQAVARLAGADFSVNVTLNRDKRVTGVFAGDMLAAHREAVARLLRTAGIPVARPYDAVVTHAGFVGINHYQAAKAGVEASKAVREGGCLILAAHHTDVDPVGSANYRRLLPMLAELGADGFDRRLREPGWTFVPDQWEVQMWGRVFRKLGAIDRLVYCAPALTGRAFAEARVPGVDGGAGLTGLAGHDLAEAMVQRALDRFLAARPAATVAVLLDGPYGVPVPAVT